MTAALAREIKSSMQWDPDHNRSYVSIYEVITDDKEDGPITALNAPGIPPYRSQYSWGNDLDNWAFANDATADLRNVDETRKLWTVTVNFSTRPSFRCGDTKIENPLSEPIRLGGSFMQFTRPATTDRNGNAIINSVSEPFIPSIEIDDSRKVLTIQKNTAAISLSNWANYSDTVNSGSLWGLSARMVKLNQWRWTVQYWGTCFAYISNEWEFHINYQLWNHKPLDAGFRHLPAGASRPNYETIMDSKDQPRHQPTPLNGSGVIVDLAGGGTPYYWTFEIYAERDFTVIGVPAVLPGPFI